MNVSPNFSDCANVSIYELETSVFRNISFFWKILDPVLIIVTNSLTMRILCKHALLETPSNIFIAWLTLSDLCFAAFFPFYILEVYVPSGLGWTISCILKLYIGAATSLGNILALLVIGIDRLIYILYSLKYYTIVTVKRAWVTVTVLALISLLVPLPCVTFGYQGNYDDGICVSHVSLTPPAIMVIGLSLFIFIPFTVGCYIKIGLVALKQKRAISSLETGTMHPDNSTSDFKITKVMLNVLIVYIGCNVMLILPSILGRFLEGSQKEVMYDLTTGIWRINKWVNPIIYVWKSKRFRNHIRQFWKNTPFASNSLML